MATSNLFVFCIYFALLIVTIGPETTNQQPEDSSSSLRMELDQLKSKVSFLESNNKKNNLELKSKDESITRMEKIILEQAESIASLQNKIDSLQRKGLADAEGLKSGAETVDLEKQVDKMKNETKMQDKKDFQGWLPDWLAIHLNHFQSFIMACWKDWWKPTLDKLFQQIQVKMYQLLSDAKVCIETFEAEEWIAVMRDQWLTFMYNLKPHVEFVTFKTIEAYHVSKNCIMSHTVKIQKAAAPIIQEALKFAEPYLNQIERVTKPYLDKAQVMLEPYSRKPVEVYRKVVTSASLYHKQVQEMLKSNELTKSLATMDLAWFMATAALCLPLVFLRILYAAIARKNERNSRRISHTRHRVKRPHPG